MSDLVTKLRWAFWRRAAIARRTQGFWASFWSFADDNCRFAPYSRLYRDVFLRSVSVGQMTYLSQGVRSGFATIANYCSIGPAVIGGGLGRHPVDRLSTHPAFYSPLLRAGATFVRTPSYDEFAQTTVGNDVWVGARAVILDGVTVGDGALIAAGALVNKNVPPFAVVAGVTARIIRYRFDSSVMESLLEWKWWTFSPEQIRKISSEINRPENWDAEEISQLAQRCRANNECLENAS